MLKDAVLLSFGLFLMGLSTVSAVWFVANNPEYNYGDPRVSLFAILGGVGALIGMVGLFRLLTSILKKVGAFLGGS
ncbi:MAG: hypothetical protein MK180_10010 [Rhodobacteraceae bacterium]|nr:hypothetical protein [Paracoccaceae bacterium]